MANLTANVQQFGVNLQGSAFACSGSVLDVSSTLAYCLDASGNFLSWKNGRASFLNTLPGSNKDQIPAYNSFQLQPGVNLTTNDAVLSVGGSTFSATGSGSTNLTANTQQFGVNLQTSAFACTGSVLDVSNTLVYCLDNSGNFLSWKNGRSSFLNTLPGLNKDQIPAYSGFQVQPGVDLTTNNAVLSVGGSAFSVGSGTTSSTTAPATTTSTTVPATTTSTTTAATTSTTTRATTSTSTTQATTTSTTTSATTTSTTTGAAVFSLDFSQPANSQYIPLLFF